MKGCKPVASNSWLKCRWSWRKLCCSWSSFTKWRPRSASFMEAKIWKSEGANSGCRGDDGEEPTSFCNCLPFAQTGVQSGPVVQKEQLVHRPVWPDTSNFLLWVFNVCTYRSAFTGQPSRIYLFFGLCRRCRDCSSVVGPVSNIIFTAL